MQFSLILATINRSKEIRDCLLSLEKQVFKDFEVIVVDQSDNEFTRLLLKEFENLNIKYFKVNFIGLSKARNFGINHAEGKYCCLIDDDAIYSKRYLEEAYKMLCNHDNAVISGMIFSIEDHITPFIKYNERKNRFRLSHREILNMCPSAALIFPRDAIRKCGNFNTKIGVGNKFASGEETDFILRLYDYGYIVYFCKDMEVFHPINKMKDMQLVYKHYLGKGALFKIDFYERKKIRLLSLFLKNSVGMMVKAYVLDRQNKELYITRKKAFIEGVRSFKF